MLSHVDAVANIAVKNLEAARTFMIVAWFKDPDGNILNIVNR